MRVLYVTTWVLGDAGANAADIFPRLAAESPDIDRVIVADFPKNKSYIKARQGAEYLRLDGQRPWILHAVRIARKAKAEDIDVIHVFYRQQNALIAIMLRMALWILGARARIVMDHRSINLAKGVRNTKKLALNSVMQLFTHHLAGNPYAVETNHISVFKPKHIIDLGYDSLPHLFGITPPETRDEVTVWFIGSMKPRNRKSWFLLDVFDRLHALQSAPEFSGRRVRICVAGPVSDTQKTRLRNNPDVDYLGCLERAELYGRLETQPGIGLAFMNHEYHELAPSLKFSEYALMRFRILASATRGLQMQAGRMGLTDRITFVEETVGDWTREILKAAETYTGLEPEWDDAATWSYADIFRRQVLGLYQGNALPPRANPPQAKVSNL